MAIVSIDYIQAESFLFTTYKINTEDNIERERARGPGTPATTHTHTHTHTHTSPPRYIVSWEIVSIIAI